jgi:hypothetical protein
MAVQTPATPQPGQDYAQKMLARVDRLRELLSLCARIANDQQRKTLAHTPSIPQPAWDQLASEDESIPTAIADRRLCLTEEELDDILESSVCLTEEEVRDILHSPGCLTEEELQHVLARC